MIARINRTALLALLALILGITAVTYTGCCSTDDDDSAADDDDSFDDSSSSINILICARATPSAKRSE